MESTFNSESYDSMFITCIAMSQADRYSAIGVLASRSRAPDYTIASNYWVLEPGRLEVDVENPLTHSLLSPSSFTHSGTEKSDEDIVGCIVKGIVQNIVNLDVSAKRGDSLTRSSILHSCKNQFDFKFFTVNAEMLIDSYSQLPDYRAFWDWWNTCFKVGSDKLRRMVEKEACASPDDDRFYPAELEIGGILYGCAYKAKPLRGSTKTLTLCVFGDSTVPASLPTGLVLRRVVCWRNSDDNHEVKLSADIARIINA